MEEEVEGGIISKEAAEMVYDALKVGRRKGRVDACRVINEMAARFPCSVLVLRECVRLIEEMEES